MLHWIFRLLLLLLRGCLAEHWIKRCLPLIVLLLVEEPKGCNHVRCSLLFLRKSSQIVLLLEPLRLLAPAARAGSRVMEKHARGIVLVLDAPVKLFPHACADNGELEALIRLWIVDPLLDHLHESIKLTHVGRRERLKYAHIRRVFGHLEDALLVHAIKVADSSEIDRASEQRVEVEIVLGEEADCVYLELLHTVPNFVSRYRERVKVERPGTVLSALGVPSKSTHTNLDGSKLLHNFFYFEVAINWTVKLRVLRLNASPDAYIQCTIVKQGSIG